jgi:phosphate-selective porin OprO/OprP
MASYRQSGYLAPAGVAAVLALSAEPAGAQSNAELMDIIRQQQRQIEELSRKVDALQRQTGQATEKANAAALKANTASEPANTATEKAETTVETAQKVEEGAPDVEVKWAPGPIFSSRDGSWSVHVLGRLMVDGGALGDDDDFYRNDNATELRSARLGIEGNFLQGWEYKFETDFADSTVDVKDAYLEYGGEFVEPAHIRVGQYKTPNSLEQLTSRRFITFMERAAIVDAFELDYQIGLGGGASGENWGVDGGLFGQNASDVQDNEGYALAGRGHYAFFPDPEDRGENSSEVVHVGGSVRYRNFDNDTFDSETRYRQRPFFHFTNTRSVDTGTITDANGDVWAGAEFAWVQGPFSLQSEVANTSLQRKHGEDDANNLWGGYLSASYFLTGEHRSYDPKRGVFDRVEVERPLQDGGFGAWEVGARADYLDLNDEGVKGGEQISYIGGLNWYPNNFIRFMLDGAVTQVLDARNTAAAVDGSSNLIYGGGVRAQVDW